jgi:hypothetical protein
MSNRDLEREKLRELVLNDLLDTRGGNAESVRDGVALVVLGPYTPACQS